MEGTQTICYFRPVPGPVSLLLSLDKGGDWGGSGPCCDSLGGQGGRETVLCGTGGFFSLSQYFINGVPGRGCGRIHLCVLQLATPGGVLYVFHLCADPVWVTPVRGSRCRCWSSSSWGSQVCGGHGQSGIDFCNIPLLTADRRCVRQLRAVVSGWDLSSA